MVQDGDIAQARLTPEARRTMLRAFADRMLVKISAMDDPEDLPGVERAVRTAAAIERIYSRCDRSERQAPELHRLEAERARQTRDAVRARVALANTLQWSDQRRKDLGEWWDAADMSAQTEATASSPPKAKATAVSDAFAAIQKATATASRLAYSDGSAAGPSLSSSPALKSMDRLPASPGGNFAPRHDGDRSGP